MNKSELELACESYGITATSEHVGLIWEGKFARDKWEVTLHYGKNSATFTFFGFTRALTMGWKPEGPDKWYRKSTGDTVHGMREAIQKKVYTLVNPKVADVLSCVLIDSQACDSTFDDWCSDLGADNDSISTLNTYIECQRNGSKLIRMLGRELVDELRQLEH